MARYFVFYSTEKYEADAEAELETEEQVIALLNEHAGNPDFTFKVIEGRRVEFEPVSVATQYRRKV